MVTLNEKATGYSGIWYANQKLDSPYVYKYSGGLGTYCAKHSPFAVYSADRNATFFCFGGASRNYHKRDIAPANERMPDALLHMVGCYDHDLGVVSRPTTVLDKQTSDAHDNPHPKTLRVAPVFLQPQRRHLHAARGNVLGLGTAHGRPRTIDPGQAQLRPPE